MNKYLFGIVRFFNGTIKKVYLNTLHFKSVKIKGTAFISPFTEITVEKKSTLNINKGFKMRSTSKIRVRKYASVKIGENFNMGNGSIITARDNISIGDNVSFGPGVLVYDHDHNYRQWPSKEYNTAPIEIGNNVWIGSNSIILRGTSIGDNSVVAAGTILSGKFPPKSLIYDARDIKTKDIK